MPISSSNYTVVQITDTHLFSDERAELLGYCTQQLLSDIIDHILLNSSIEPNAVFVTGDISQDETASSYQLVLKQFERLTCPVYWIHGNHDDEEKLKPIFERSQSMKKLTQLATPYWDFISINTCKRGTDKGYITENEYAIFLSKVEVAKKNNKKIVVVMHHHPVPVNTPLIDEYILENGEKFINVVQQSKEVNLIICGHVHGDYKIVHNELIIETCPATCFQWKKGAKKIEIENRSGYKIFNFNAASYTSSTVFI